jgi:hypothetical protein
MRRFASSRFFVFLECDRCPVIQVPLFAIGMIDLFSISIADKKAARKIFS